MTLKKFMKELSGERVEGEIIKSMFYSFITSFFILLILYLVKFRFIEDFMGKYGFYLFFAMLSYSLFIPIMRQVRAYKEFNCMAGMMIGMTSGMIVGFLVGFYTGATNGMLMGSVFGSLVGILFGVWLGSCCGVMGFLEGIMAGFMGGLMGAMTAVMMINDNLQFATVFIFIVTTIILLGLNYMVYLEAKEVQREVFEDHTLTIIITFVLIVTTVFIMLFGPRSLLFGG
jgi:hypothetical protein